MAVGESEMEEASNVAPFEKLGAIDIVEAFTALRQDLKVQVRGNRELQKSVADALAQLESKLTSTICETVTQSVAKISTASDGSADSDRLARRMAEALAEIDETIQRIVRTMEAHRDAQKSKLPAQTPAERVEQIIQESGFFAKFFSKKAFDKIRSELAAEKPKDSSANEQAMVLLSQRVERLMGQLKLERIDVRNCPFDPQRMRAVDVIDAPGVTSSYVAEQLRPAYMWRDQLLRFADVRLAK